MNKIFKKDNSIILDEQTHKYILKGKEKIKFVSVTTCISEYFEIFDKEKIAYKLVTYNPKYAGKTVEELIGEWEASASFGTAVHKEIEDYINHKNPPTIDKAIAGINWLNKYLIKSEFDLFSEVIIYCENLKIAGTIDLIVYDKLNKVYHILDWKTSKSVSSESYKMKKGNKPETEDLLDSKFNHYALQLSLYRYLLEKNYDITIDDQIIVHIDNDSVHGYITPYLLKNIESILNNHKEQNVI